MRKNAVVKDLEADGVANELPTWKSDLRELTFRGRVVKRYRVPSGNQELILATFQELGWPRCIDDPLPPNGELDPKLRLQATIKSLNRSHLVQMLSFHGNGTGMQIYWKVESERG